MFTLMLAAMVFVGTVFSAVTECSAAEPAKPASDDLRVLPEKLDGLPAQQMMHRYLMRLALEAFERREANFEKLKTAEEVQAWQQRLREFFLAQLGGPPPRGPLNARVVGRIDCEGYRVEKIIFESQPRHYVTALLYLPDAKQPYPGVLVPCGHSANGKAMEAYQRACILLAQSGMAALCYDPIDQGERYQLLDDKGKPLFSPTMGHCLVGVGSILLGRNTATYRVWDGMRAIDYLASRPEIDPRRIGCTGNSGGGTLTAYLMALDDRIACAAASCYLTSLRRLLETIGPQDAEQNIHAQIAFGMDHADYVIMRAPKPTLMLTATHDYFDISGAWASFRQAKRTFARLGFPERVDLVETDAKHGFSPQLRVGAARWMRRWLLGIDDAIEETEAKVLTDQQAQCTADGQVMLLPGARSVFDLNLELERQLAAARERLWQQTDRAKALEEVRRVTGIRRLADLPEPKVETQPGPSRNGYRIEKLIIRPEEGIALPALLLVPEKRSGQGCLYLNAAGKHVDAAPGGPIEQLVTKGQTVLAVDLRGCGETQATGGGGYGKYLGPEWADGFIAYMLQRPYLTMRAEDVLVCARWLAAAEAAGKPGRVHLVSIGNVGPPALHAVALEPQLFASAVFRNCLQRWSLVVATPTAKNQFINVVHGALRVYDLPDLLATLPKDKVRFESPVDAEEKPLASSD